MLHFHISLSPYTVKVNLDEINITFALNMSIYKKYILFAQYSIATIKFEVVPLLKFK